MRDGDGAVPAPQQTAQEDNDEVDAELEEKMRCVYVGLESSVRLDTYLPDPHPLSPPPSTMGAASTRRTLMSTTSQGAPLALHGT